MSAYDLDLRCHSKSEALYGLDFQFCSCGDGLCVWRQGGFPDFAAHFNLSGGGKRRHCDGDVTHHGLWAGEAFRATRLDGDPCQPESDHTEADSRAYAGSDSGSARV